MSETKNVEDLFAELIELDSALRRSDFLDQNCSDDPDLRRQLEGLYEAHASAGSFLDATETLDTPTENEAIPELEIGPYKLLQKLGEGGMGIVYLAERQKPVKQRVALKIVKLGMDSKKFVARFEAERQALAMMDHPNIAKVLDAGCTDSGRPYFVMELVKGVPISEFCDDNRLTTRERLQLFVQVCQAVHHAHQKGIIHRDIKPSNVLVALYDDKPVPKVIDFGVAKATNQQLTEKTLFTEVGSILGTWEYMSPEQAVLNQLDVDTRTDVYSLGVLLYELLTGETPLDRQRLRNSQIMETLRMIREDEPPKPSTRLSSRGESATKTAAYRKSKPTSLASEIRGDLDWIVMKALDKERVRRYDSANRFAEDVERYLIGDLVDARPPSLSYRMLKLYQRNKVATVTGIIVVAALLVGLAGTSVGLYRAERLRVKAEQYATELEGQKQELQRILINLRGVLADRAFDATFSGDFQVAEESIEQAASVGAPDELVDTLRGVSLLISGQPDRAIKYLEATTKRKPKSIAALAALSWAYLHDSDYGKHESTQDRVQLLLRNNAILMDTDKVFLSLSEFVDGDEGMLRNNLRRVDELIARKHNWGVAYLLRAKIRAELARDAEDIEQFGLAINDIEEANSALSGSEFVTSEGLMVFVDAIALAKHHERTAEMADWLSRANRMVAMLNPSKMNTRGLGNLACFHYHFGDASVAAEIEKQLINQATQEWIVVPEKLNYSRSKAPMQSWRMAKEEKGLQNCLALTLACSQWNERDRSEIEAIINREVADEAPTSSRVLLTDVALVLNDQVMLRKLCDAAKSSKSFASDYRWWQRYIEYQSGELKEIEYQRLAEPSHYSSAFACYGIAMKALSEGDVRKAEEFFKKTIDTRTVTYWSYHNAKFFDRKLREGWRPATGPAD